MCFHWELSDKRKKPATFCLYCGFSIHFDSKFTEMPKSRKMINHLSRTLSDIWLRDHLKWEQILHIYYICFHYLTQQMCALSTTNQELSYQWSWNCSKHQNHFERKQLQAQNKTYECKHPAKMQPLSVRFNFGFKQDIKQL